jgi:DNA invertase Pin-like site-specific DNA recombinase
VAGDAREHQGLRHALSILRDGQADLLVVVNLSRLARSASALAKMVDAHFDDGTRALIAIGESLDTRTANGRFVLRLLGVIVHCETEVTDHA